MTPEQIFISEKLQPDMQNDSLGVYERNEDRIIILRSQLASVEEFLGTLIHELTHADSGINKSIGIISIKDNRALINVK